MFCVEVLNWPHYLLYSLTPFHQVFKLVYLNHGQTNHPSYSTPSSCTSPASQRSPQLTIQTPYPHLLFPHPTQIPLLIFRFLYFYVKIHPFESLQNYGPPQGQINHLMSVDRRRSVWGGGIGCGWGEMGGIYWDCSGFVGYKKLLYW